MHSRQWKAFIFTTAKPVERIRFISFVALFSWTDPWSPSFIYLCFQLPRSSASVPSWFPLDLINFSAIREAAEFTVYILYFKKLINNRPQCRDPQMYTALCKWWLEWRMLALFEVRWDAIWELTSLLYVCPAVLRAQCFLRPLGELLGLKVFLVIFGQLCH